MTPAWAGVRNLFHPRDEADMLVFIISRIANAIMVMLAVAMLAFVIFRLAGDPVELMASEQMTQEDRDNIREKLGLNDSTATQFVRFVTNAAQGDFGMSYRNGQDVLGLIAERFPATLELVLVATLISLVLGLPLGVLTAIKRGAMVHGIASVSIDHRRFAAKLRCRHPAYSRLLGDTGLVPGLWAWRRRSARLVVDRAAHAFRPRGAVAACRLVVALSNHPCHAPCTGRNA
jgi:hypothetical protein